MSDNDKVELIAIAQVTPSSSGIAFASKSGFEGNGASRITAGAYILKLEHSHDASKLVINATLNSGASGEIVASPVGTGDTDSLSVNVFDGSNTAVDTPFFITVYRVRS